MIYIIIIGIFISILISSTIYEIIASIKYDKLEKEVLTKLGFENFDLIVCYDANVVVKSRQSLSKYNHIQFFKENKEKLSEAAEVTKKKNEISLIIKCFLDDNEFKGRFQYKKLNKKILKIIDDASAYRIEVSYITPAGNNLDNKVISLQLEDIVYILNNTQLLMGKGEYNNYKKEMLDVKRQEYYKRINDVIYYADENRNLYVTKSFRIETDNLVSTLIERTIRSIKQIKTLESEEWKILEDNINKIKKEISKIVEKNDKIIEYYGSSDFLEIKKICNSMMSSQKDFNEYITEKAKSINRLLGNKVIRNETTDDDKWDYIRPYKKNLDPFNVEVSATVFESAENNPLEYIAKYYYPNKEDLPIQIQKLSILVEELETLKEAKKIIDIYKSEYEQYLKDVPDYVIKYDEAGFYSRLGFANIDNSSLSIEYKFSYTSGGGKAQRSFSVPMTEENVVKLISLLQSKLSLSSFTREQRKLMTKKLRESIKIRDNYTCRFCGNSMSTEPNLLLEIDHIIPISKGGYTIENNLQTLCWRCNRAKGDKIIELKDKNEYL